MKAQQCASREKAQKLIRKYDKRIRKLSVLNDH